MDLDENVGLPHYQQDPDLAYAKPRFPLGQCLATPGAIVALTFNGVTAWSILQRHAQGDWGDLSEDDKQANEFAVVHGARILSSYKLPDGERIWVITEWNRSATTILLPEEY